MKWARVVIIELRADPLVMNLSEMWRNRYPGAHCFTDSLTPRRNFQSLIAGCLQELGGADTKVIVCAHGDYNHVGQQFPDDMADILQVSGIGRIGLLTFKSCRAGKERYLSDLNNELAQRGVQVGWIGGYTHNTTVVPGGRRMISGLEDKIRDFIGLKKASDKARLKIIRGNDPNAMAPAGGAPRYV